MDYMQSFFVCLFSFKKKQYCSQGSCTLSKCSNAELCPQPKTPLPTSVCRGWRSGSSVILLGPLHLSLWT